MLRPLSFRKRPSAIVPHWSKGLKDNLVLFTSLTTVIELSENDGRYKNDKQH